MKRIFTLIIFLHVFFQSSLCQNTFSKIYYTPYYNDINARCVISAFDNGFIIGGNGGTQGGLIYKIDSVGNIIWQKTLNIDSVYQGLTFNSIIATADSNFLLAGRITNLSSGGYTDAFCVKINSVGDTIWTSALSQTNGYFSEALNVQQTNDLGYIIVGDATDIAAPFLTRILVAKYDSFGNLLWTNVLTGGNITNYGYSIKQTPDSGYILTGYVEHSVNPNLEMNAFLVKLTSVGSVSWGKKYSRALNNIFLCNDVLILNDGYLCYLYNGYNFNSLIGLMKVDFSGNIIWKRFYNRSYYIMSYNKPSPKIHITNDSGYVFVNRICWSPGSGINKVDSLGNPIWATDLFLNAVDLVQTNDRGFLVAGNGPMCALVITPPPYQHIGLIKTDSVGLEPTCISLGNILASNDTIYTAPAIFSSSLLGTRELLQPQTDTITIFISPGCVGVGSGIDENDFENNISLFPNPTTNQIEISSKQFAIYSIEIYDVLGQKRLTLTLSPDKNRDRHGEGTASIDVSELAAGIYFVKVKTKQEFFSKKFIISR